MCALLATAFVLGSGAAAEGGMANNAWSCGLIALALAPLSALWGRRGRFAALILLALGLGLWRGAAAVPAPPPLGLIASGSAEVLATVTSVDSRGVIVDIDHIARNSADIAPHVGALLSGRNLGAVQVGDQLDITASAVRLPPTRPGSRSRQSLARVGVVAVISVSAVQAVGVVEGPARWIAELRQRLVTAVDGYLPEPTASLALGIAFGVHRALPSDLTNTLQASGLYHIVATSGLKVVIVTALVIRLLGTGVLRTWPIRRRRVVGLLVLLLYIAIAGGGAAALRSAATAWLGLGLSRNGRRLDPLVGLAAIAVVMSLLDPHVIVDTGFQLSFVGTAGIILMTSWLEQHIAGPRLLAEPFAVTVAASLATAPLQAIHFGVISLVGPIANALAVPLLPPLMALGGLGALLATLWSPLGFLPLQLCGFIVNTVIAIATWAAALPGAAIQVSQWPVGWGVAEIVGAVVAIVFGFWLAGRGHSVTRRFMGGIAMGVTGALLCTAIASGADGRVHVTVLDVGAATATLLEAPDGSLALIDGGADSGKLLTALGRELSPLQNHIDTVVITAADRRAAAGLVGLVGHYSVAEVVVAAPLSVGALASVTALQSAGATVADSSGARWRWGGLDWSCQGLDVDHPNDGCSLSVSGTDFGVEICGVLPPAAQEGVANGHLAQLVVAAPGGVAPALLAAVQASMVAVPSAAHSQSLKVPGVSVAATGSDGDLHYSSGDSGLAADRPAPATFDPGADA